MNLSFSVTTALGQQAGTADSVQTTMTKADVNLDIKPSICVAPRGLRTCSSDMDIDWLSSIIGNYCLHSRMISLEPPESANITSKELQCWLNSDSGHHHEYVVLNNDLEYSIQDPKTKQQLTTAKVKIAMLKPHRKYPRRRSRLPWSVIKP